MSQIKGKIVKHGLVALVLALLSVAGQQTDFAKYFDYLWDDFVVKKLASEFEPDERILIIDIDDRSLKEMESVAGKWPWPRSIHAFLLEHLAGYNEQAIVFDVMFAEKDLFRPESDAYFAEVVSNLDNVYFAGTQLNSKTKVPGYLGQQLQGPLNLRKTQNADETALLKLALPEIMPKDRWKVGSINFEADQDGVGRYYDVERNMSGWLWQSLPSRVVFDLKKQLPPQSRIRLRWVGEELFPFNMLSFSDVFFALDQDHSDQYQELFKDKIVIIGSSATGLFDLRSTPMSMHYPAVAILATALDNLLQDRFYRDIESEWLVGLCFLLAFLFSFVALGITRYRQFFVFLWPFFFLASATLLAISWIFAQQGWIFPVAYLIISLTLILISISLQRGLAEYFQRQRLIVLFGRFMDPRVVNQLIDQQELGALMESKTCQITVLFSDIRGFTSLSEKRTAQEVVTLLNEYFTKQVETIFKYGGTLDKFIGDAIMAFWGAPLDDSEQADNAVKASLEMIENLKQFRTKLPSELSNFDVGIGLHTGPAVVGMIGSEKRFDYTAIGDTVNLASRIEGLTKNKARLLVSEDCIALCRESYQWFDMGSFQVKGREKPVHVMTPNGGML